jgi:hypothetical protein
MSINSISEIFCVIELAKDTYFSGHTETKRTGSESKIIWGSVGTPLLARRVDPDLADLSKIHEVFPNAQIRKVTATYTVGD